LLLAVAGALGQRRCGEGRALSVTGFEFLWGSDAFWRRAARDIALARRRLFVQAMTFEGDAAGLRVAAAIRDSVAVDRRVLVDAYTRHVVNDRFVWTPSALADSALRNEIRSTRAMFVGLAAAGVKVRMTNPVGAFFSGYAARNHKKLILADDVAYIGGVNFSDHNFAWSDFMIRFEGAAAARFLAEDFEATFAGVPRSRRADINQLRLYSLDGRTNARAFAEVMELMNSAEREITVVSPYLTFPFTDTLAEARRRGVRVRLITPRVNNKPAAQRYVLAQALRHGFDVRFAPPMSHVKAILIDDEHLIAGSSNFDFVSFAAEEELLAIIASPALVEEFRKGLNTLLGDVVDGPSEGVDRSEWLVTALMKIAACLVRASSAARRTAIDWPN